MPPAGVGGSDGAVELMSAIAGSPVKTVAAELGNMNSTNWNCMNLCAEPANNQQLVELMTVRCY